MTTCGQSVSRRQFEAIGANLVEFELVEQVVELAVFGGLLELDVVLLQTMKGELGLVIDVDFQRLF